LRQPFSFNLFRIKTIQMKIVHHAPNIWSIENFLSEKDCNDLIAFGEMLGYSEAALNLKTGAKIIKGIRNNLSLLYKDFNLAEKYWERLKPCCPEQIEDYFAIGLNEQFRFYKYKLNQRFKRHADGRFKRNESEESRITFMIYLNDDFEGGETAFDEVVIKPKTGSALCFIHELKHEGCPIISGEKYVLRSDVMYRKS
jgi:predicted 2-oxoglutarate/Fe(II)-dependent dioxygenase YbiX